MKFFIYILCMNKPAMKERRRMSRPFHFLYLSLILILPLAAASSPPIHQAHFTKDRRRAVFADDSTLQEYLEVSRPLPLDSFKPSCSLPILSHKFANTIYLPPITTLYSPPKKCTWSSAVLHLSASSNGSQYNRIAAVWLAGAEILRTSTPEPTQDEIFWNVRKDVTRYASLLVQSDLTLSVMLENIVNDVYTGVYRVNLTILYYNVKRNSAVNPPLTLLPLDWKSSIGKLENPLNLNENPADLIIPISASGDEGGGFWFRIQSELNAIYQGVQIPLNTYRAVIEVYVSFHGNDEFWYSNPPDAYLKINNLPTKRGNGAFREVLVKIDDDVVGSVYPFPVIFAGGINPSFWKPLVSIGAFDLPSYEIELTPFLGLLLDGKEHFWGLGVTDAISFWLVDANLHLWLDHRVDRVQAGAIEYHNPSSSVDRNSKFQLLDGKFEIEGERESEFSGWVLSSAGNFTTYVSTELTFENTIKFKKNGTEKSVEQEIETTSEVKVVPFTGKPISNITVERKYHLEITTSNIPGSGKDTNLVMTKLEHSLEEEVSSGNVKNTLVDKQKSRGWMFVKDHEVLSGAATTSQNYKTRDGYRCYSRQVLADGGSIKNDIESFICPVDTL